MSLDFGLVDDHDEDSDLIFSRNITHNLAEMASEAGVYDALWCSRNKRAKDIIPTLEVGYIRLRISPFYFAQYEAPNGWGQYKHLLKFVKECLTACKEDPEATIWISK